MGVRVKFGYLAEVPESSEIISLLRTLGVDLEITTQHRGQNLSVNMYGMQVFLSVVPA